MLALIDGDEIVYVAGFGSQHAVYRVYPEYEKEDGWIASFRYKKPMMQWMETWGPEGFVWEKEIEVDSIHLALYNARIHVETILRRSGAHEPMLYFTGENNKRLDIAKTWEYKGNRDPDFKPFHYQAVKDFLQSRYPYAIVDHLEADDCLAINQKLDGSTIICTQDKDLNMVPGMRYNPNTKELYNITPIEACRFFYKQLITGDVTDNIPSVKEFTEIKRIMKKKHLAPIDDMETEEEMYQHVLELYEGNIEAVKEIGNLLWMCRTEDDEWVPGKSHFDLLEGPEFEDGPEFDGWGERAGIKNDNQKES